MSRPKKYQNLRDVFPGAPFVERGFWSFANQELQLVYPEICVFSETLQKEVYTGVVIHPVDIIDAPSVISLLKSCNDLNIVLYLLDINKEYDPTTIQTQILIDLESRIVEKLE